MKANGTFKKKKQNKNPSQFAHMSRFNDLSEVDADGNSRRLTKAEKKDLYMK